ncbi:MAG: serine/threonine-protein kinase [Planctomycetota bacterium]
MARGGMGVVYRARQASLKRDVAVKMILGGELAGDEIVQRFRAEAEAAAQLRHPGIVAIHEIGEHLGQPYFSMEFVEGESLGSIVDRGARPGRRAARYVREIADAVHYAHEHGVLHRDLKPSNVLIDVEDRARVTDFGLAKRIEGSELRTVTGAVMGTPSYMSPEQALGDNERVGPRSDVYSIGAVLYELLTGVVLFRADTPLRTLRLVVEHEPPSPRVLSPAVPQALDVICMKCLAKQPERRYATAGALADDLGRFLDREPIAARGAAFPVRLWGWARKHPWTLAAVTCSIGAALAVLAYALSAELGYWRLAAEDPAAHEARLLAAREQPLPGDPLLEMWVFVGLFWAVGLGFSKSERALRMRRNPVWPWSMAALGLVALALAAIGAKELIDQHVWRDRFEGPSFAYFFEIASTWAYPALFSLMGPLVLARAVSLHDVRASGATLDLSEEQEEELSELLTSGGKIGFRKRLRLARQRYVEWTGADAHHASLVLRELWSQEHALRPDRVPPRRDWISRALLGAAVFVGEIALIAILLAAVTGS